MEKEYKNPFSARGTVVTDENFFVGRNQELKKINNRIFQRSIHTNLSIVAEKGMGASSLIFHALNNNANEKIIIEEIDLSTIFEPEELFIGIAKGLLKKSKIKYNFIIDKKTEWHELFSEIKLLFEEFNTKGIKAICVIDEFDKVKELFADKVHYFQSLRNIAYSPTHRISLITISRRDIEKIELQAGGISNFHQVFEDTIILKPYNIQEQKEYFNLFSKINIQISKTQKDKIIYYSGACPYLLNLLCYEIFEYYQEKKSIDIELAFKNIEDRYYKYYTSIIKYYKVEERYEKLLQILNNETENISKYQIKDFEKTGLLVSKDNGNGYRLFSKYIHKLFENEEDRIINDEISEFKDLLNRISEWLGNGKGYERLLKDKYFQEYFQDGEIVIEHIKNNFENISEFNQEKLSSDFSEIKDKILIPKPSIKVSKAYRVSLSQIQIKNYYDIINISIEDIPLDTKWIFLTGENGFGKTLLLQAIAAALNGEKVDYGGGKIIKQKDFNVAVEIVTKDGVKLQNYKNPFFKVFNNFVAYGPYRLKIKNTSLNHEEKEESSRTYSIFNNYCELLSIEREMLDLQTSIYEKKQVAKGKLNDIKEALKKLLHPHINDITTKNNEVKYIENGSARDFLELASGMKSIIAMIGDMIIRLFLENKEVTRIKDLTGIVIIDEIELYLHVKLQRRFSNLLSEIFPNILFIASTHSPIPILGAPKESIILKVLRTQNDTEDSNIEVEKFEGDFKKLLPNALLTSSIFDFEHIIPEATELQDVSTADSYKEHEKREALKRKLGIIDLENEEAL